MKQLACGRDALLPLGPACSPVPAHPTFAASPPLPIMQRQWAASPTRFWSTGLQDYLRNVAKIRREFADVLSDDGGLLWGPHCASATVVTFTEKPRMFRVRCM